MIVPKSCSFDLSLSGRSMKPNVLRTAAASVAFVLTACQSASLIPNQQLLDSTAARPGALRFHTLFDFDNKDGGKSVADLVNVRGTLYGTTSEGGGAGCGRVGCGTVFTVRPWGDERVLYSFKGTSDGENPLAGLTYLNGDLYGTAETGGDLQCGSNYGCGTVFKITKAGKLTVLYRFKGGADGEFPSSVLAGVNGVLYGTTRSGGDLHCELSGNGCGTVFSITTSGQERQIYAFKSAAIDGALPLAGLTNVNGKLYGTTAEGGSRKCNYGCGTVFEVTTSGKERVIYKFQAGSDGVLPRAGLIYADGALYGITSGGRDATNSGTVFKITTSGKETILYQFLNAEKGAEPAARLGYFNGALYGTTYLGGDDNDGVVFKIDRRGKETVLHSFSYDYAGGAPAAGLTEVNGTLYGTSSGGANSACQEFGCGAIFELTP